MDAKVGGSGSEGVDVSVNEGARNVGRLRRAWPMAVGRSGVIEIVSLSASDAAGASLDSPKHWERNVHGQTRIPFRV